MKKIYPAKSEAALAGLFAFLFGSILGVSQTAIADRLPEPPLHPKTYHSPSGAFSLFVDPSDRQGRGSADYHLLKGSREVWHGERPFTLRDVRVLDDGTVAGYGYTQGPEGWGGASRDDYGEFVVAVFDPQGKVRLKEAVRRGYNGAVFEDQYPQPEARGLVVDSANDRLIVLVADPDINRQNTAWQQYRLSAEKSLGTIRPKQNMADSDRLHWSHDPRPIPGTPLTLVQWYRSEWEPYLKGTHFAVVDMKGMPIWQRTLRDDYTIPGDEKAEDRLFEWFRANSAVLSVEAGGRFDLFFAKEGQRVSFAVQRDHAGAWKVTEIGRKQYNPPKQSIACQVTGQLDEELPRISLDYLGAIELRGSAPKSKSSFDEYDLRGFTIDKRGRFVFIQHGVRKEGGLVRIDKQGAVVGRVPLPALKGEHEHWSGHASLGDDRFAVTKSQYGDEKRSKAWIADFASGKLAPLPDFECPSVDAMLGLPNGGFAVLATHHSKYTMEKELRAYDAKGRLQWKVGEGQPNEPETLFSPEDICLTPDGLIAVIEVIGHKIKFYNQSGHFVRLIDLTQAWGREPRYPCEIEAMPSGELLVGDAVASGGVFVRMASSGKIRSEFSLRFPNGRQLTSSIRPGPDGRMWTSQNRAILEVNYKGVVEHIVGEPPTAERLDGIAAATADRHGRLYALDEHTYCVHVFSLEGKPLFLCKPDPREIPAGRVGFPNLTVSDAGEILVSRDGNSSDNTSGGYLRFSAEGRRQGVVRLNLDSITEEWHFQPGTGRRWVRCYKEIALVDARDRVTKTIKRRPNGDWLDGPDALAVAPDGSMVVFDCGFLASAPNPSLNVYSADGEPVRTFPTPAVLGRHMKIAFNGEWIAATGYNGPLALVDRTGKSLLDFGVGKRLTPNQDRFLFFSSDGKELRILDAETQIVHRFALPKAG
jgi:hypothetical protein